MKPDVTAADEWDREDAAFFAFLATERIRALFPRRSEPAARAAIRAQLRALCNAKRILCK